MVTVEEVHKAQRVEGPAIVKAIGTATPPNCVENGKVISVVACNISGDKSMIKKRYMYLTEEILKEHPNICAYMAPSLDARQDTVVVEIPKLGKEAAVKAIKEWGQPKSKITHLVFCTTIGVDMPGVDYQLTKLLSFRPSMKRLMMYQQGCFAGGTVLCLAKDLAENNKGACVLVALFGDGAAAIIVGVDPVPEVEIFELVYTAQTILPDSDEAIDSHLREVGLTFHLLKDVTGLISKNIEKSLVSAFKPLGISDWNYLFWIAHPGGPTIFDQVESKRKSVENGLKTTGEGLEWGVLFGFGPGLTVKTVVLHSLST
ncbi:hypothetical protein FH972_014892 [Carpinus fangiana]|uniref:Chalcone synthase n=1 Tax=Carpinus fangiana TaxID=176857 RepID=A0A5N6RBP8_9ROSI|nr:hypothetical protein FH972_014892 [Carpinus fangiana]